MTPGGRSGGLSLDLSYTEWITDAMVQKLPALTGLTSMDLRNSTRVSEEGARALRKSLPSCKVDWGPGPVHVKVGFYVLQLSNIDAKQGSYWLDFYIWFRHPAIGPRTPLPWNIEHARTLNAGKLPDLTSFEIINCAKVHSKDEVSIYENEEEDEENYSLYRVQATVNNDFVLRSYPFDSQELVLQVQHPGFEKSDLVYEPDTLELERTKRLLANRKLATFPGLDPQLAFSDWELVSAEQEATDHSYLSGFGSIDPRKSESTGTRLTFKIRIRRVFVPFLLKFLLPLLVILSMAYGVLFLATTEVGASSSISVAALLSAIALHLAQTLNLPETGYLVAADQFIIWSYVMIALTLLECILCHRLCGAGKPEHAELLQRVSRVLFPVLLLGGYAVIFGRAG